MPDTNPRPETSLTQRWSTLVPADPGLGANLIGRYAEAGRYYHDVRHLSDVLDRVDTLAGEAPDPDTVRLAAWFHDAVYDVRATDNEEQSAILAEEYLTQAGIEAGRVAEVARLVRLTKTHASAAGDANGAVLCDADLAILASDTMTYEAYSEAIRQEYAWVSDDDFRVGRADVLRRLLGLPHLFATPYARTRWERPARANIKRELATLLTP